jgi:hypothetical protein
MSEDYVIGRTAQGGSGSLDAQGGRPRGYTNQLETVNTREYDQRIEDPQA